MTTRRAIPQHAQLGKIFAGPPKDHLNMNAGELLNTLLQTAGWSVKGLTNAIEEFASYGSFNTETVKSWKRAKGFKTPTDGNRRVLVEIIESHSATHQIGADWLEVLSLAWARSHRDGVPDIVKLICKSVSGSPKISQLPALFGINQSHPIATAYVELALARANRNQGSLTLLDLNLSLAQRMRQRAEAHFVIRQNPKNLLDQSGLHSTIIIGPPGAGKSSLLRHIALQISQDVGGPYGESWNSINVPLFVEARIYWRAFKSDDSLDLLSFALGDLLPSESEIDDVKKTLLSNESAHPILLLDGLDEIVNDPDAVDHLYSELQQLKKKIPWIVSTRPTGLVAPLHETQRCEMVGLDDEAVETLIDNWSASFPTDKLLFDCEQFKMEIFESPSTRDMADNPFLLSALCFLKIQTPEMKLPKSRVEVYESLIERVALQAQTRERDVLTPEAVNSLQEFSYHLYNQPDGGPVQVFSQEQWWKFKRSRKQKSSVDFEKHILPSRLITKWGAEDPYFHFIHLSLHEYMVARAMLNYSLKGALERRFLPGWRSVFRFYGALLLLNHREQDFRQLVQHLFHERDINHLTLITLSDIFSCIGIKDTTTWIDDDLREYLYSGARAGYDAGPDGMIYALAELDPQWLELKVLSEMDGVQNFYVDEDESFSGKQYIIRGRQLDSRFLKLARAKTASAKQVISDAFWGDDQDKALLSAFSYSLVSTPLERQKLLQICRHITEFDDMTIRLFAFAQASRRHEFVPFLGRIIELFSIHADGPFQDALSLVADIGGEEASHILDTLVKREAGRLDAEFNAFEVCLNAVVHMGGANADRILTELGQLDQTLDWHAHIHCYRLGTVPDNEVLVQEALSTGMDYIEITSALCGAAIHARIPSDLAIRHLEKHMHLCSDVSPAVQDLSFIESERLDSGMPPILCADLLLIAQQLYDRIQNDDEQHAPDYLVSELMLLFDTFGRAPFKPARALAEKILFGEGQDLSLVAASIQLLGLIYAGTSNQNILKKLKELLFKNEQLEKHNLTLAIGRIDIEELFRLQSADSAHDALEEIAAENDFLIFDNFWVDKNGHRHNWISPPQSILYISNTEPSAVVSIISHELSQYGYRLDASDLTKSTACIVFGEPEDQYANELIEAVKLRSFNEPGYKVFFLGLDLTDEQACKKGHEIRGILLR